MFDHMLAIMVCVLQVLTIGSWPTQAATRCNLPQQMQASCDVFQQYYSSKHR